MTDKRKPGQSQLDYLWVTYGNREVSSELQNDLEEYIPTQLLLNNLFSELRNKSVGSISSKNGLLIIYSTSGLELGRVDVSELNEQSLTITDFGRKVVSILDTECPFEPNTRVYYIKLSNGLTFYAPSLQEGSSNTITTLILDDTIISSLKIDEDLGNVLLTTENGLRASLPISNLDTSINFLFLTEDEFNSIDPKLGTVYFIQDKSYFYFGPTKIGNVTNIDLFEVVDKLPLVGDTNKIYLVGSDTLYAAYIFINGLAISIGNTGTDPEVTRRLDNIENTLTWVEND